MLEIDVMPLEEKCKFEYYITLIDFFGSRGTNILIKCGQCKV